jgi:hypothetical protein
LILNVELLSIQRHHIAAHVLTWLEDRLEVLVWHLEVTNSIKGFTVKQTQTGITLSPSTQNKENLKSTKK